MSKIENSMFKTMTIKEVIEFISIYEHTELEFWDLVDLYRFE